MKAYSRERVVNLVDLREVVKFAKELRDAGVLQVKLEGLELTLAPAAQLPEPRSNEDTETDRPPVAPTAVKASLDFLMNGGRGRAPQ